MYVTLHYITSSKSKIIHVQHIARRMLALVASCMLLLVGGAAAGLAPSSPAQVPTQVIIQFTSPAAASDLPISVQRTGAGGNRLAASAAVSTAASAEHASFLAATAGLSFTKDHAYVHVRTCERTWPSNRSHTCSSDS